MTECEYVYSKHESSRTQSIRTMVKTLGRLHVFHDQLEIHSNKWGLSIPPCKTIAGGNQPTNICATLEVHHLCDFVIFCNWFYSAQNTHNNQHSKIHLMCSPPQATQTLAKKGGGRLLSCCDGRSSMLVGGMIDLYYFIFIQHRGSSLSHLPSISSYFFGS